MVLHYEDGDSRKLVLKERENIGDWNEGRTLEDSPKIWRGHEKKALYEINLKNPRPAETITRIDLVSAKEAVAPFFVAITLGP